MSVAVAQRERGRSRHGLLPRDGLPWCELRKDRQKSDRCWNGDSPCCAMRQIFEGLMHERLVNVTLLLSFKDIDTKGVAGRGRGLYTTSRWGVKCGACLRPPKSGCSNSCGTEMPRCDTTSTMVHFALSRVTTGAFGFKTCPLEFAPRDSALA